MTRLEQLRVDALLTPEQLGELAGVGGNTIRRIESGKGAQVATLGRLAACFKDVKASDLTRPADDFRAVA